MCTELNDVEKIDLIMLLGDSDFIVSSQKNKICVCGFCDVCSKLHQQSKIISSKLKIYRTLTKDLDEMNKLIYLFTNLRGLELKFDKTYEFDSSIIKKLSEINYESCEDTQKDSETKVLTTKNFKKQQPKNE